MPGRALLSLASMHTIGIPPSAAGGPAIDLEQLELADLNALRRFARWLGVGVPDGEDRVTKQKVARRLARALKHGARGPRG